MPEKELMLRLRWHGEIVGYENILIGVHYQALRLDGFGGYSLENDNEGNYLLWDSFDMGIKVDGEWWFEGDRIGTASGETTLVFDNTNYDFNLKYPDGSMRPLWYVKGEGQSPRLLDGDKQEEKPK